MATYIARDDFLKVKKSQLPNIVGYFGQLALDENNVMYVYVGNEGWRSMTEIVANFTYASDQDVYNVVNSVDLRDFLQGMNIKKDETYWDKINLKPEGWV